MRTSLIALLLSGCCFAQTCVIVKAHEKTGADKWRWTVPRPFEYVEGDYPSRFPFKHEISDRQVRQIQELRGNVVVIKSNYTMEELKDARQQCSAHAAEKK